MANTFIAKDLKKHTTLLTKDGRELEGLTYRQFKAGVLPVSSEPVVEETVEEKRARLQAELDSLN